MLGEPWRITLFGSVKAENSTREITRFRTQKTASLFAYLAYHSDKGHSRETLVDILWPEHDFDAGRLSLRVALSSLRHQLEPPGIPPNSVLSIDYHNAGINPLAISTDTAEFETLLRSSRNTPDTADRLKILAKALSLYTSPLLPGFYEDWIAAERLRLDDAFRNATSEAIELLTKRREWTHAIDIAHRQVQADPLHEEGHMALIKLYSMSGQQKAALQHFRSVSVQFREALGQEPSRALRELVATISSSTERPSPPVGKSHFVRLPARPQVVRSKSRSGPSQPTPIAPALPASRLIPLVFTRFYGREKERLSLTALLNGGPALRLVTLSGPGGIGKTRLAIEFGNQWADEDRGAVFFVPLAHVDDPGRIAATIEEKLGLSRAANVDPVDVVAERLSLHPSLLILDNYEQLAEEGTGVVRALLQRVPTLRCLVTSRCRLNLEGEREFPLSPLPTPEAPGTPEEISEFAGVRLLVDRAQAIRPDFQITPRNCQAIGTLCHTLEGIPLALELAAGWVQTLTPVQILNRLERRFDLLVSRHKDQTPRHQTLRAAIDWSFHLLTPELQQFFTAISVFRGGFSLEAVAAVCSIDGDVALERFTLLRERSLLTTEEFGNELRGRMLETIREYASEKLDTADRTTVVRRHVEYFAGFAEDAWQGFRTAHQAQWMEAISQERENIRQAITACLRDHHNFVKGSSVAVKQDALAIDRELLELAMGIAGAIWRYWTSVGRKEEIQEWLIAGLASTPSAHSWKRARALNGLGALEYHSSDFEASIRAVEEAMTIWDKIGYPEGSAEALNLMGILAKEGGDQERAEALCMRGLVLRRDSGSAWGMANSLSNLGSIADDRGNMEAARGYYQESLDIQRKAHDAPGQCDSLLNLGGVEHSSGRYASARLHFVECASLARQDGLKPYLANALKGSAETWIEESSFATAVQLILESLQLFQEIGDRPGMAVCIRNQGLTARLAGRWDDARRYCEESLTLCRTGGDRSEQALAFYHLGVAVRGQGDRAGAVILYREALNEAKSAGSDRAVALTLEQVAVEVHEAGDAPNAVRLWGAADRLREGLGHVRPPSIAGPLVLPIDSARRELGEQAYLSLGQEGRAYSTEQAIALALALLGAH